MAGEILYAGIADLTQSEALSTEFLLLLADRNALPNHPSILYVGDISGQNSAVIKVPHIGLLGYNLMASTGDGSAVANTALTDGSTSVTVGRYSKSYEASDMARITAGSRINPQTMALDAVVSGSATLAALVADVIDGFTATQGSTGVNATFQNYLDSITTLEIAKVGGPYLCELHPVQWGDIRSDVAGSANGAIQWNQGSQALLDGMKGIGYQGVFLGVDVYTTTHVPTANAGADRAGGMWGRGGVLWADGSVPLEGDPNQLVIANKVLFERDRTAKAGLTAYVSHRYLGVAKGIDACGVSIITDA